MIVILKKFAVLTFLVIVAASFGGDRTERANAKKYESPKEVRESIEKILYELRTIKKRLEKDERKTYRQTQRGSKNDIRK